MFGACNSEKDSNHEVENPLFVGTYRVLDRNIPYPFLLEKREDTVFLINHKNEIIDKAETTSLPYQREDTLKMQEHSFLILNRAPQLMLLDLDDSILFPHNYFKFGALFRKAVETKPMNLKQVKDLLSSKTYTSSVSVNPNRDLEVVKTWRFSKDSLNTIFSYFYQDIQMYSEQHVNGYQLFQRSGKIFLSENGTREDPKMLYQITDITADSFDMMYYRNNEKIKKTFQLSKNIKPSHISYYSNCLNGDPGEYYHDNITFNKGNEYLIKKIAADAPSAKGNGYITVHFTINCEGNIGRLGLEQMDRDYKSIAFNPELVKHIINKVTQLKDWPEVKPGVFYKDVHAFLMFKIENGEIIDLCP